MWIVILDLHQPCVAGFNAFNHQEKTNEVSNVHVVDKKVDKSLAEFIQQRKQSTYAGKEVQYRRHCHFRLANDIVESNENSIEPLVVARLLREALGCAVLAKLGDFVVVVVRASGVFPSIIHLEFCLTQVNVDLLPLSEIDVLEHAIVCKMFNRALPVFFVNHDSSIDVDHLQLQVIFLIEVFDLLLGGTVIFSEAHVKIEFKERKMTGEIVPGKRYLLELFFIYAVQRVDGVLELVFILFVDRPGVGVTFFERQSVPILLPFSESIRWAVYCIQGLDEANARRNHSTC